MSENLSPTVTHAFMSALRSRGQQPFITFYDDATGERVELSGVTLGNWVAKTANLLVDGLGLQPEDRAAVRLPAHWQSAAILLGCWTAGLSVDVGTPSISPGTHSRASAASFDIAFVTGPSSGPAGPGSAAPAGPGPAAPTGAWSAAADHVLALSLAPLGMPFRPGPPPGTEDFTLEVRQYGDRMPASRTEPAMVALAPSTTHEALVAAATALGKARGMPAGGRVLIDGDADPDPALWLVAPLLLDTSIVLCRNLDATLMDGRLTNERAVTLSPP